MDRCKKESEEDRKLTETLLSFFKRVGLYQKEKELSDNELGKSVGIDSSLLSHYRAGRKNNPAWKTIRKLERRTGICTNDFE